MADLEAQIAELEGSLADAQAAVEEAPEEIVLRMGWWGNDDRASRTLRVIQLFEAAYPNIRVVGEPNGGAGDHFQILDTQLAADNAPDIIQFGGNWPDYKQYLEPLNGYLGNEISAGGEPSYAIQMSQYLGMSAASENKEAAALFINFFVTSPEAGAILETNRGVPSSPVVRQSIAGQSSATDAAVRCGNRPHDPAGPEPSERPGVCERA